MLLLSACVRLHRRLRQGNLLWRTHDAALERRLRGTYEGLAAASVRRLVVDASVSGAVGQEMCLTLTEAGSARSVRSCRLCS